MTMLLFMGIIFACTLLPQMAVKRAVHTGSKQHNSRNMTGKETAERILLANNITNVKVEPIPGELSDHYDPKSKTIRLSDPVYGATTVTAQAIAAHEVGHAIQDSVGYMPLKRSGLAPLAIGASQFWMILLLLGAVMGALGLIYLALALYASAVLFQFITLPVEFDASRRAGKELDRLGLSNDGERRVRQKVLGAAALTYVAAALASVLTLLYYIMIYARR